MTVSSTLFLKKVGSLKDIKVRKRVDKQLKMLQNDNVELKGETTKLKEIIEKL
jgi:hypothetical protein